MNRTDELNYEMTKVLRQIKKDREINRLYEFLKKNCKEISSGKVKQLINLGIPFNTISAAEYYILVDYLKKWSDKDKNNYFRKIDLDKYFDENERKAANRLSDCDSTPKELKIKAFSKGTEDNPEWIGIMSYEEIVAADRAGQLIYNLDTQRLARYKSKDGISVSLADIDEDIVEKISQKILNGSFQSNTITLNILRKGLEEPYVNVNGNETLLVIDTENKEVDIIDGMHRIKAIGMAYNLREKQIIDGKEQKQIEGTMAVCVKNLTERKALDFIYQESLANKQHNTQNVADPNNPLYQFFAKLNEAEVKTKDGQDILTGRLYLNSQTEGNLSTAFISQVLESCKLVRKFHNSIVKSKLDEEINRFISFINKLFDELQSDDIFWENNRNLLLSQYFITGCFILYFSKGILSNQKKIIGISDEKIIEFAKTVKDTINDPQKAYTFDFPFTNNERKKVMGTYTI